MDAHSRLQSSQDKRCKEMALFYPHLFEMVCKKHCRLSHLLVHQALLRNTNKSLVADRCFQMCQMNELRDALELVLLLNLQRKDCEKQM